MKLILDLICNTLKEADIAPVYMLGAYKGSVDGKRIVVKPESASQYRNYTTTINYYSVLCYGRTITEAVELADDVIVAMNKLKFSIMPTYGRGTPYWDSTSHGWQVRVIYRNFTKNE